MSGNTQKPKRTTIVGKVVDAVLRFFGLRKKKKDRQGSDPSTNASQEVVVHTGIEEELAQPRDPVLFKREQELAAIRDKKTASVAKAAYEKDAKLPESSVTAQEVKAATNEALTEEIAAYGVLFKAFQQELNGWVSNPAEAFGIPKGKELDEFQTALKEKRGFDASKSNAKTTWHKIYWDPVTNNIFRYVAPVPPKKTYADRSNDPTDNIKLPNLNSPAEKMQHVMRCCFHTWRMSVALGKPDAANVADQFLKNVMEMKPSYVKYAFLKCMIDYLENLKGVNMNKLVSGSTDIQQKYADRGADKETREQLKSTLSKASYLEKGLPPAQQKEFQALLEGKITELTAALKVTEDALYKPKRGLKA